MEDLREFSDPDTVDLMQWIQQNTEQYDAISGSMQLMAGVKLCTGRPITNHPHFEDKRLRDRTREVMLTKISSLLTMCFSFIKCMQRQALRKCSPFSRSTTPPTSYWRIASAWPIVNDAHSLISWTCLMDM